MTDDTAALHPAMEDWADITGRDPASAEAETIFHAASVKPVDVHGPRELTNEQRDLIIRAAGYLYDRRPSLPEIYCAFVVRAMMFASMGWPSRYDSSPHAYAAEVDRRVLYLVNDHGSALDALLLHDDVRWEALPPVVRLALHAMKESPGAVENVFTVTRSDARYAVDWCELHEIQQWMIYRND